MKNEKTDLTTKESESSGSGGSRACLRPKIEAMQYAFPRPFPVPGPGRANTKHKLDLTEIVLIMCTEAP